MQTPLPNRKRPRLNGYDYGTVGAYFVTICTKENEQLFGTVENGEMYLSELGKLVGDEIKNIETHYNNVKVDKYIVMPNHIHMIVVIDETDTADQKQNDISNVIGKFKAGVTRLARAANLQTVPIWQKSYNDHIIRGEKDYAEIWQYIDNNVIKWECTHQP